MMTTEITRQLIAQQKKMPTAFQIHVLRHSCSVRVMITHQQEPPPFRTSKKGVKLFTQPGMRSYSIMEGVPRFQGDNRNEKSAAAVGAEAGMDVARGKYCLRWLVAFGWLTCLDWPHLDSIAHCSELSFLAGEMRVKAMRLEISWLAESC